MTSYGVVLIVAAALSVQIMQTSAQLHKKKHRCVSLKRLPQPELETRSSFEKSLYSAPKSLPTLQQNAPLSKPSSTMSSKSSDSVPKPPSPEQKSSSQSVTRSLNTVSKFSSDSFAFFKLPLQLITRLLSPLLPSTTRRNTSSVIAPSVNFNMPLTFSTIHSPNPIPCKNNNSPVPCNTHPDTKINIPCDHQPCNIINNSPSPCNIQPGTANNIDISLNPLLCTTNTSMIPCNSQQKESNKSYHAFIYYWLCGFLLNNLNNTSFCNTTNPSDSPKVTASTVNPLTTTPTDSPITDDRQTTTTQTDDVPTTATTDISSLPTSTTPKSVTTEEPIPPSTIKPKCTTKHKPIPSISTTPKCPSNEPVSSTPLIPEYTTEKPSPPHIVLPPRKTHKPHRTPCSPPIHLPAKPTPCTSILTHTTDDAPLNCRHHHSPVSLKLHPPNHSSLEIFKPLFKSTNYKSNDFDQNSQDLLLKLIASLTSNTTTSIPANT